jgi:hypothetical protein
VTVQEPPRIEAVPHYREGRELAALRGGPWANAWYWRDELEAQQQRALAGVERGLAAAVGWKAAYAPTSELAPNPSPDPPLRGVPGRVWIWTGEKR